MIKLNKSTRYALCAAVELAQAVEGEPVTAAAVARRYEIPPAVLAKVFQQLVHAGIAVGTRGSGGGYRLARRPSELTVLDVMEVFESPSPSGEPLSDDDADHGRSPLARLLAEVDEQARCTFASITLETLIGRQRSGGRPGPSYSAASDGRARP